MGDGGEVERLSRLRDDLNQSLTSLLLRTSFPTPMGGSRRGAVQTGSGVQGRSAVPATGRGRRVGASPGGAAIFLDSERELSRNYPYQAAWTQVTHHPRREPS